jgi:hypothetical protein
MPARSGPFEAVYRASIAVVAIVALTSIAGLFGAGQLYAMYPASLAGLVGQDAASLAVGIPVLAWAMREAKLGSIRALLVWAGSLFYFAYSYAFYVVGGFNSLFLLYVAIVAVSLYALLGLLLGLDVEGIRAGFDDSTPKRLIGGFLTGIAVLFIVMWGGMSASLIAAGELPDAVVHLVVAIDLAILLPALLVGGSKLWRGQAWGFALGGILLVKTALTGLTLAFTTALDAVWAGSLDPFNTFLLALFGLMGLTALCLVPIYFQHLDDAQSGGGKGAAIEMIGDPASSSS